MGKRRSIRRVTSESVQGEGSWVEVTEIRYGEYKRLRRQAAEGAGDELDEQMIHDHVAAWNWVDDNDIPVPLPSAQLSVIDDLTVREKGFLIEVIFQVEQNPN